MKHEVKSRLQREMSITSLYTYDSTLMAESNKELKSFLMKVKEESEKVSLKFNIKKKLRSWSHHHITNRWGEMETVKDFIFLGSKITVDGDCSQEIKRHLILGRKAMTNLDKILKNREITLPTKAHIIKAVVYTVVMYKCESLTIKKAEC